MQDVIENEYRESLRSPQRDDGSNAGGSENDSGFIVKGGPWEQQQQPQQPQSAPNTASVEEFPQFAGYSHVPVATPDGPWGIKR
jgi:hypothetical protein